MSRRFLFVVPNLGPLGPALQLRLLAKYFASRNYELHVVTLDDDSFEHLPETETHAIRKVERRDTGIVLRLRRLIQKINPEVVHAWCQPAINYCGLALSDQDSIRFVCTDLDSKIERSYLVRQFRRRMHRRPEKFSIPHPCLKSLKRKEGIREHRVIVIPNAYPRLLDTTPNAGTLPEVHSKLHKKHIDQLRCELRDQLGIPRDALVAGTVADLEPSTRLKDLIWATDLLACIRDDFHFVLFGDGLQLNRLKKFSWQTDAAHHIHFMGMPHNTLPNLLGIDFYWNSHLQQPLNSLVLGIMAEAIPVISVLGDGMEQVIHSQQSGLATNLGARDEFARWTKYLIEQPESRYQLARQGAVHVRRHFGIAPMIDGFESIYDWRC